MAVDVFNRLASLYQEKYMDVSLYHASFDLFCREIQPQKAQILELACGPGNITRYLLQKRPDFQLFGTDLAPQMVELARKNNPQASFQVWDCREILALGRKFDGIMCGFALPYLSREEAVQLIADAAKILHPGGVLYLSTMEDDYAKSGLQTSSQGDQVYQYFHEAAYLEEAFRENGFALLDLQRKTYPGPGDALVTDLLLIGKAI